MWPPQWKNLSLQIMWYINSCPRCFVLLANVEPSQSSDRLQKNSVRKEPLSESHAHCLGNLGCINFTTGVAHPMSNCIHSIHAHPASAKALVVVENCHMEEETHPISSMIPGIVRHARCNFLSELTVVWSRNSRYILWSESPEQSAPGLRPKRSFFWW